MKIDKTIKILPKPKKIHSTQPKNDCLPAQEGKSKLGENYSAKEINVFN